MIFKTSSAKSAEPKKDRVGVDGDSKTKHNRNELDGYEVNGGEVRDNKIGKKVQKTFKFKKSRKSKKTVESDFLTLGARLTFIKLRQIFFKASILHHFDLEYHILVETDAFGYAIGGVLSQLTLDNLSR